MKPESIQSNEFRIFVNGNLLNEHGNIVIDKNSITFDDCIVQNIIMFQIPRKLIAEALLINYSNTSALEIYCHSLQSYVFIGTSNDLIHIYDKLGVTRMDFEERLVGCESVPHHQHDTNSELLLADFHRMGIVETDGENESLWRICRANSSFVICTTYPRILAVPTKINDTIILHAARFRTKGRLPILSYKHVVNGACITRSSQPMSGIQRNRSIQDEKLVDTIRHSSSSSDNPTPTLLIVDARPQTNAVANTVVGAGVENMTNYRFCERIFVAIENIHVLRESAERVLVGTNCIHFSSLESVQIKPRTLEDWQKVVKKAGWTEQVMEILKGTMKIVHAIINGISVLVHCSDGWDRTAQLTSLASICLDPFYRTTLGLEALIEREWLQAGHKFDARYYKFTPILEKKISEDCLDICSQTYTSQFKNSTLLSRFFNNTPQGNKETAPIFPIFLDCLLQLIIQFPNSFEYNHKQLIELYKQVHCKCFGNSELERAKMTNRPKFDYFNTESTISNESKDDVLFFDTMTHHIPIAYFWHVDLYANKTI